jgi:hypothetical protein
MNSVTSTPPSCERRYRDSVRATFGRKSSSLQAAQDRGVALDPLQRPCGREHASDPAWAVTTVDPEHADVKRVDSHHADAVCVPQMRIETVLDAHLNLRPYTSLGFT